MDHKNYGDNNYGQETGNGGFGSQKSSQKHISHVTLTPVTIKQINESVQIVPDGDFKIHNLELSLISFIGVVRKVENNALSIILTIEDGTGSVEVKKWIDETVTTQKKEIEKYESKLNKYVFIGGALNEFNGKKNIQVTAIYSVTDHNQLLYHNLNVIYNHLKSQDMIEPSVKNEEESLFVSSEEVKTIDVNLNKVLSFLKKHSNSMQEGVPLNFIVQSLNISRELALNYCQELIDSGKLYTGYDDTSFICI